MCVLAQSRKRLWISRLATASIWRILLHAIRSLWAGTNAATRGALFDTISSGIGSGSGRPVEATLKCRSCGKAAIRRRCMHMITLTETREGVHAGGLWGRTEKAAGQYPAASRAQN